MLILLWCRLGVVVCCVGCCCVLWQVLVLQCCYVTMLLCYNAVMLHAVFVTVHITPPPYSRPHIIPMTTPYAHHSSHYPLSPLVSYPHTLTKLKTHIHSPTCTHPHTPPPPPYMYPSSQARQALVEKQQQCIDLQKQVDVMAARVEEASTAATQAAEDAKHAQQQQEVGGVWVCGCGCGYGCGYRGVCVCGQVWGHQCTRTQSHIKYTHTHNHAHTHHITPNNIHPRHTSPPPRPSPTSSAHSSAPFPPTNGTLQPPQPNWRWPLTPKVPWSTSTPWPHSSSSSTCRCWGRGRSAYRG